MKVFGYATAHFCVDLCCALLLFRHFTGQADHLLVLLLYNFCAFALQLPFGILADRLNRNHTVAAVGMLLVAIAPLFTPWMAVSVVLAGCGNGLFHVGGGIAILQDSTRKAFRLGLFVAPGAMGLFLGTCWGKSDLLLFPAPLLLGLSGAALLLLSRPTQNSTPMLSGLPSGLWALFGVVVLRSYLGFCMNFSWANGFTVATVAVLGKIAGGFLLDRLGYRNTALCTLVPAGSCLLASQIPFLGLLGIFFFQMTMPVTLWAAARYCPHAKGFSFGLLTFGLFLGFLPVLLELPTPNNGSFLAGGVLVSLLLLLLGGRNAPWTST